MSKFLLPLSFAIASLCCMACSFSNGPERTARQAIEALQKRDYDAFAATYNLSSSDKKILAGMAEEKIDEEVDNRGGIKKYKIVDSQVEGKSATVIVHLVYKDASEENLKMELVKVGNEWKQEFDK